MGELLGFGQEFYECLTARADALFELAEAVLCTEGPGRSLVGLSLAPEHRRLLRVLVVIGGLRPS